MPCSCFWWGMQRFEQVRRKPQLFVFERSEEFCAAGASPYRPLPRITSDTLKPPKMGAFCHGGEYKESSRRGRKPSAIRVRSAAENFAAHAASPYRPLPRITSDTLKPPKMGAFCYGGECERIERARAQALGCACSERSGELCRACGKPLPSPAPHYFRYIKTAQNGRSFAWSFFRLSRRFSYKTAPAEVKTRANTTEMPFPLPFGMRQILF